MSGCVTSFGGVEFDGECRRLRVAGRTVKLDRSCAAILSILLNEAGKDVDKDRLLEAGWPGRVVHENSLAKAVGRLRQALGEDGEALETVHGRGYRLVVETRSSSPAADAPERRGGWRWLRHPAFLVAVPLMVLSTWGLSQAIDQPRPVINGEPANSIGRILWVDNHPDNVTNERRFLERRKVGIYQVKTTDDALTLLRMYGYTAVISDMGRDESPLAGLKLLQAMRARGDRTPFVLYTVHSSKAQRKLIADSGGQGVAETPEELYAAVVPLFGGGGTPVARPHQS